MNETVKRRGSVRRLLSGLWRAIGWVRVSLANLVFLLVLLLFVSMFAEERRPPIPERAALVLALSGEVVEEQSFVDPLARLFEGGRDHERETLLQDVIEAITRATEDPRIEAIVLSLDGLAHVGITKTGDMAAALDKFRAGGKKIIATGDSYSQDQYLLAVQADEVWMHPMGEVSLSGIGYFRNYFAAALEKLDVDVHVFRAGTYKSAYEFLERSDMSDADRYASSELLHEIWDAYATIVTQRRNLPPEAVDHFVDEIDHIFENHGGDAAAAALEYGLVDALMSRVEVREALGDMVGTDEDGELNAVDFRNYLAAVRPGISAGAQGADRPAIGVLVASGLILDGDQAPGNVGGDSLSELIREASRDEAIKGLVLRIDSPGGSAFASELIREALVDFRDSGKSLVASMGSVAASGGYWIASPAQELWASPTTITGSIGVLGMFPSFARLLERWGIHNDGVGTSAVAGGLDVTRPLAPQVETVLRSSVQATYRQFLRVVAEGRQMDEQRVEELAQGRVWSGAEAQRNGLVDHAGNLEEAVRAAARLAGIEDYETRLIRPERSWGEQLLERLSVSLVSVTGRMLPAAIELPQGLRGLLRLTALNDPRGMYAVCTGCIDTP